MNDDEYRGFPKGEFFTVKGRSEEIDAFLESEAGGGDYIPPSRAAFEEVLHILRAVSDENELLKRRILGLEVRFKGIRRFISQDVI